MVKSTRAMKSAQGGARTSPQEPRRLRTRAALLRAGAALLAERPIDAIAIDEIVEAADVGKGSFFNHFESKDALAGAIAAEIREEIGARVRTGNIGIADPAECVAKGVCVFVRFALSEPGRALIMLRDDAWVTSVQNPLNRGLEAHIAEGIAKGRFKPRAGRVGVAYIVGLGHTLVFATANDGLTWSEAVRLATDILVLALAGLGLVEPDAGVVVSKAVASVFQSPQDTEAR